MKITHSVLLLLLILGLSACNNNSDSSNASGDNPTEHTGPVIKGNPENKSRPEKPAAAKISVFKTNSVEDEGTILSETYFDATGNKFRVVSFDYYGSGKVEGETLFEYDDEGNCIKMDDGTTITTREFDGEGRIIREQWSRNGKIGAIEERNYDKKGNITVINYLKGDGSPDFSRETTYEYNEEGKIVKEERWEKYTDGTDPLQMYSLKFEHNEAGLVSAKDFLRENGSVYRREEYFYDPAGNLIETQTFEEGNLVSRETNTVNEFGEVIETRTFSGKDQLNYTNTYEFDEYGRPVKMFYQHVDGDAWGERTVYE